MVDSTPNTQNQPQPNDVAADGGIGTPQAAHASCTCKAIKPCPCHVTHPMCFISAIKNVKADYDPGSFHNTSPTAPGLVNGHNVRVLRDSGCSGTVVKTKFVEAHQYTGQYRLCLLIDGTVRKVPVAKVLIDSP